MTFPTSESLPPPENDLPPARRRRKQRRILPEGGDARSAWLEELARLCTPDLSFFLLSAACGLLMGAGLALNFPALVFLSVLAAPFLAPVPGLGLASVAASRRFFFQSLGSALIGGLLAFFGGALAGWAARLLPAAPPAALGLQHALFTWPDFLVLSLGAVFSALGLARRRARPLVSGLALTYELYLPLAAAGFGLAAGVERLFPEGLMIFLVHLAWAVLAGTLTFILLGLRPGAGLGYTLGGSLLLIGAAALAALGGFGAALETRIALPSPLPSATRTLTPAPSGTPLPSRTPTPTNTLIPSRTPTLTLTPEPTPVWAKIFASDSDGALVRREPNYTAEVVKSLLNGTLVQVLPDTVTERSVVWVKVRTGEGVEGWMVRVLLVTATPVP